MDYDEMAQELFRLMCRRPEGALPSNGFRGQYIILRCLLEEGGQMFAGDLAQALGVTSGRIATAIKRLEAMGLAKKQKNDADGRKTTVVLTEAGREALRAHENRIQAELSRRLRRLSPEEAAEYLRLTQKLR